jgi:hypothetical protein
MTSHDRFKANLELPFELIADTEEKLCHMFGVVKNKIMYGKKVKGIERSTFLIDAQRRPARRMARPHRRRPRRRGPQGRQGPQEGGLIRVGRAAGLPVFGWQAPGLTVPSPGPAVARHLFFETPCPCPSPRPSAPIS